MTGGIHSFVENADDYNTIFVPSENDNVPARALFEIPAKSLKLFPCSCLTDYDFHLALDHSKILIRLGYPPVLFGVEPDFAKIVDCLSTKLKLHSFASSRQGIRRS